ncbi:response regulator [Virgibacillus sp. C22-A2]|uniref:Response regulator n=1 Tax=Virgibacillus tibetensis TaxID=3042313 RepID=A0ABU6KH90_9BACI|nr:response regulator [Virgibacillus sp. C22-A2]
MGKKKILVVDDQPGIRLLLTDILISEGFQVSTANTGKEALDKIYSRSFDLLIIDYNLPIINGIQVLQQMETDNIRTPAILMSGLAEDIITEAEEYTMVKEVLAKPFNIQDICISVKSLLN